MPETDVVSLGGGAAGMAAELLFARAGVRRWLEKHADFQRDFRGDTAHPSTLPSFDEFGLSPALLARPHDRSSRCPRGSPAAKAMPRTPYRRSAGSAST